MNTEDKLAVSTVCISMAKDLLEVSTHTTRDDKAGAQLQFTQLKEKLEGLSELLEK